MMAGPSFMVAQPSFVVVGVLSTHLFTSQELDEALAAHSYGGPRGGVLFLMSEVRPETYTVNPSHETPFTPQELDEALAVTAYECIYMYMELDSDCSLPHPQEPCCVPTVLPTVGSVGHPVSSYSQSLIQRRSWTRHWRRLQRQSLGRGCQKSIRCARQ